MRQSLGNPPGIPGATGILRKEFDAGTHRIVSPAQTLSRVRPLMPVMGITRIANVTGLDTIGIPVVMVTRPNSRSVSVAQGKGATLDAAKASGLMESVESYHAERISLPLMLGSFEDLRYGRQVVEVERLPHLTDSLYTPHTQILWIEGRNLMDESVVWVPYEMVHLDYTLPLPTGHGCFVPSSNGLASGNHLFEAMSHGICEVVERDSTTLWHLLDSDEQEMTRVNLDTIKDPVCRELLDKYRDAGVLVAVWETTSDVGVPAFLCRILQEAPPPYHDYRPASGMGCHPTAEIAMSRALTEAAQSRLTFISGARDDLWRSDYDSFLDPETHKIWLSYMEKSWDGRPFDKIMSHRGETFEDDIAWQLERLRTVGVNQAVAVDLTKPEFGIPVVRMIIPGLEGMDHSPKYVPGDRARHDAKEPMSVHVFLGPSLPAEDAHKELDATFHPPVAQGDIIRLVREKPAVIGIIDGYFEGVPSVWHKEILFAMARGIHVVGASSMGALRAAELYQFGMEGVGAVFEAFRDGRLEDDDEVAVIHGPPELGFPPLSEAMVNIRRTLSDALAHDIISEATRQRLEELAKMLPYKDRTFANMIDLAREYGLAKLEVDQFAAWLPNGRVDQKREDALLLLRSLRQRMKTGFTPKDVKYHFEHTTLWERTVRESGNVTT